MKPKSALNRREFVKKMIYGGLGGAAGIAGLHFLTRKKTPQYNVLLIIADDLRPQLGCYGETQMKTPNIDRLASQSIVFDHSYCQVALCAPSRACLLTGLRPDSTHIIDLNHRVSEMVPNHMTLPGVFKKNGYLTLSAGKVYHHGNDDMASWSEEPFKIKGKDYCSDYWKEIASLNIKNHSGDESYGGPPFEKTDVPDNFYKDGKVADYVCKRLTKIKNNPFFYGVGFIKPHLPFNVPRRYWEMYDPSSLKLPSNSKPPVDAAELSLADFQELRKYYGIPEEKHSLVPEEMTRQLIHGYYASVSFLDAQVGRVLDALETSGLSKNTIVILWGDNGFKLGEHGNWCKHSNMEDDTRVPLIIRVPGLTDRGRHSGGFVESVDIYPSLCELCDLDLPNQNMEGTSFVPLLETPARSWKKAVFSQYLRGKSSLLRGTKIGYAIRTSQFRYIEWRDYRKGKLKERELYDHKIDPGENINVISDPRYRDIIPELEKMMKNGWKGAKPD